METRDSSAVRGDRIELLESLLREVIDLPLISNDGINLKYRIKAVLAVGKDATQAVQSGPDVAGATPAVAEEAPSEAVRIAQKWATNGALFPRDNAWADIELLAREVLRLSNPAVTAKEWRTLGYNEGLIEGRDSIYVASPEAKDAARYRWLRLIRPEVRPNLYMEALDEHIDRISNGEQRG